MRLNEATLSIALKSHKRRLHLPFLNDFLLSQSVQALNIPTFPRPSIDCPIFHACKINKTLSSPDGTNKTKNSNIFQRNKMQLAKPMLNNAAKILCYRLKIHPSLHADESLLMSGSLMHSDFTFYDTESIRGHTSGFDIIFLSTKFHLDF